MSFPTTFEEIQNHLKSKYLSLTVYDGDYEETRYFFPRSHENMEVARKLMLEVRKAGFSSDYYIMSGFEGIGIYLVVRNQPYITHYMNHK